MLDPISMHTLNLAESADRVLYLSESDYRLVMSGLKRLRHQIKGDIARQKREGWKPAPGHNDNNLIRLAGVDALLKRYGTP